MRAIPFSASSKPASITSKEPFKENTFERTRDCSITRYRHKRGSLVSPQRAFLDQVLTSERARSTTWGYDSDVQGHA